ncbi:MAG: MarR family transcriptional regulator [Chloroflexota bacterium]|nr:MAG: MarR family transcriptional regulator [Chloroflexota bacterium]
MIQQTTETGLAQQVGRVLGSLIGLMTQYSTRELLCLMQREDLSLPRLTTLMMLSRRGAASVSDISEHLNLSLGATSHLVDKLVDAGLCTRAEDPEDRRQKHIALTDAGRQMVDEVRRLRVEEMARRLEGLPEPLLASALDVLTAMDAHLRANDTDGTGKHG